MRILFQASATAVGGRRGYVGSDDGALRVSLADAADAQEQATSPEQLIAAGYAVSLLDAIQVAARETRSRIGPDSNVTAQVAILADGKGKPILDIEFNIDLPGVDRATAETLVDLAHISCPYARAMTGELQVRVRIP